MSDIILKATNISKQYRLGTIGTGTVSHDLNRWWHKVQGKEDPFLKIGEANDRSTKAESDYVWALKDINFEVKRGEVLGIIGKNGAGKSTLLKILSRVTSPTTGEIKTRGRIASLLEVGTGFHPEMTGRENIFLNGAILGMTKSEIHSKIDEIIDFSGCERYIDTPVKRYSSGMTVRLAFAVAAHLEPDILVIDEVLAVGDAEFQKKAIGKMQDISKGEGRTVLFVSHNMAAVKSLCTRGIVLEHGEIVYEGNTNEAVDFYLNINRNNNKSSFINKKPNTNDILEVKILDDKNTSKSTFGFEDYILVLIKFRVNEYLYNSKPVIGMRITDQYERNVFTSEKVITDIVKNYGDEMIKVRIPKSILMPNLYKVSLGFHIPNKEVISKLDSVVGFRIVETGTEFNKYSNRDLGCVVVKCNWTCF